MALVLPCWCSPTSDAALALLVPHHDVGLQKWSMERYRYLMARRRGVITVVSISLMTPVRPHHRIFCRSLVYPDAA